MHANRKLGIILATVTAIAGVLLFIASPVLAQAVTWTSQFGTNQSDLAQGLAVDGTGNVFVVGFTEGTFFGQTSAGQFDAFVRKYDPAGAAVWTRQLGSSDVDFAQAVTVDAVGGVYVLGYTLGILPGQTRQGDADGFIREYDTDGFLVMTSQFGMVSADGAIGVAAPAGGTIAYVAGYTSGILPGQTPAGSTDAFVMGINVPLPDLTPPVVNVTTSPAPNPAGWNNTNVTAPFIVIETLSGLAAGAPTSPLTLSAEGAAVNQTVTASDIVIYVAGGDDKGRRHDDDDVSPTAVQIGEKNTVVANIYAPNGTIHLRASTQATGAFIGKRVIIGEKVELTLKSAF
ncbi:MAG: SBBP repeat-containing protein [Dehalococcoidia bacterium]|nr:SBBP repeat-containing protein [Dehalococcoidia bacterium]